MSDEITKIRLELIKELGLMAYKFLITLNSGAFIVLLTFIGNISDDPRFTMNLGNLKYAMYAFLGAISLTFLSMTIAYLSAQLKLVGKSLPFSEKAFGHIVWLTVPVILAFCAFVMGATMAIQGIVNS